MKSILIIGHGFAGRRYSRALRYLLAEAPGRYALAGVVDRDPARLASAPSGCALFTDTGEALARVKPDVVVLAVNEEAHFEVLGSLPDAVEAVLSEKPLTATLEESLLLADSLSRRFVSVNFVERHSPVLAHFDRWRAASPALQPRRVEFFWGKDRIGDTRPTMGVLSEISHPLDLVDFIVGFQSWTVLEAHGSISDFAPASPGMLDSVSLLLETDRCMVIGHSSFVWSQRHRQVTVFLSGPGGEMYKASFEFDVPRWDCDTLTIDAVGTHGGPAERVLSVSCRNDDFPGELDQIFKVAEFTRKSLDAYAGAKAGRELADFAQALKIQRLLGDIGFALHTRGSAHPDLRFSTAVSRRAAEPESVVCP